MSPIYSLIDEESANQVGSYSSEEVALRAVYETIKQYGPTSNEVVSLALLREDSPMQHVDLSRGLQLALLAVERFGDQVPR